MEMDRLLGTSLLSLLQLFLHRFLLRVLCRRIFFVFDCFLYIYTSRFPFIPRFVRYHTERLSTFTCSLSLSAITTFFPSTS